MFGAETKSKREAIMQLQVAKQSQTDFRDVQTMKVADIMTDEPVVVRMNEDLEVAWDLMEESNFRHLPVVDRYGDIQGIISERDLEKYEKQIRRRQMKASIEATANSVKVKNIMTKVPETASPDMSLFEAGTLLLENKISCLPVVDGSHLVGILTEADFVKLVMLQAERD